MAWTAPTTRSTGDLITASIWNTDLKDNLDYLKTEADKLNDVTQTDQTGSRAVDGTIYQNTGGKVRLVTVTLETVALADEYYAKAYCENATPPTIIVAKVTGETYDASDGFGCMTFIVPPSSYYKVTETGDGVLEAWLEWDIH